MAARSPKETIDCAVQEALQQLGRVLGPEEARRVLLATKEKLPRRTIDTAQELMALAEGLMAHRGFLEVVGRSLKVQALLLGARVSA